MPLIPRAYRPLVADRTFRRLLAGFAVSYLGDGMSAVAVAWLAIQLAPRSTAGLWVGAAVAAYALPGVVGALTLGRWLRRLPAQRLLVVDSTTRAVFLGAVPVVWLTGTLRPGLYVVLLACSSLLHAWGAAGRYTLVAELLPDEHRLAANTAVGTLEYAAIIAGPAVAGLLVTVVDAAFVIGIDATTFVVLAVVACLLRPPGRTTGTDAPVDAASSARGLRVLTHYPALLGLVGLTWLFNFLYGPVEVALPLHVTRDLHAGSDVLGLYWTIFGVGAIVGSLVAGSLRRLPLWPTTLAIVIGWGVTLLPFWAHAPTAATVVSFGLGGVIYGPFVAVSITLVQGTSPPEHLSTVLAARGAALLTASPLGTAFGGPVTTALGPRATLGGSGLATIALGVLATALVLAAAVRRRRQPDAKLGTAPP
ncbi:MAG: MFS transporter [Acidothermales bacterium]|nr:MFS transporter [Acidothermales bacterium]